MIFFTIYLLLSILMLMNKIYCLVHHTEDFAIKNFINTTKNLPKSSEALGTLQAHMMRNFYGGLFAVVFVFLVEMVWFMVGLFSFMWPLYIGIFIINYTLNSLDHYVFKHSGSYLAMKIFYVLIYLGFLVYFLNHYYHFIHTAF
jgi:hypothetical protein